MLSSQKLANKKHLLIIYTFTAVICQLAILICLVNIKEFEMAKYFMYTTSISLLSFFFYFNHKIELGFGYLFTTISLTVASFEFFYDSRSGISLYYFPIALAIATTYNFKFQKEKVYGIFQYAVISILLLFGLVSNNLEPHVHVFLDVEKSDLFSNFNKLLSFTTLIFFTYFILKTKMDNYDLMVDLVREEMKIKKLVVQKNETTELLVAEIHHRLKNNLSINQSIFNVKFKNANADNFRLKIDEVRHGMDTVALANKNFNLESGALIINMTNYIEQIIENWQKSFPEISKHTRIYFASIRFKMNLNDAIPIGLILHELLFYITEKCAESTEVQNIKVKFLDRGKYVVLNISSNFEESFTDRNIHFDMIEAFTEQLESEITYNGNAEFSISLPKESKHILIESSLLFKD